MSEEVNQITINLGSLTVGIIISLALAWAIYSGEMGFAHFNVALLTALAIGNHVVKSFS